MPIQHKGEGNKRMAAPSHINLHNAEVFLCKLWRPKGLFSIKCLCKLAPLHLNTYMLWVYGEYTYYYSFIAGIDFRRQSLTSTDVRF